MLRIWVARVTLSYSKSSNRLQRDCILSLSLPLLLFSYFLKIYYVGGTRFRPGPSAATTQAIPATRQGLILITCRSEEGALEVFNDTGANLS